MKPTTPVRFIRVFHRWSGVLLIFIVGIKIVTGLNAAGQILMLPRAGSHSLHLSASLDVPLLFLFYFHSLYGLFKIFQSKIQKKVMIFWCTNAVGILLFIWSVLVIYLI